MPQHQAVRCWWEGAVNSEELIGLPYEVAYGFARIATNQRLGAATVSLATAGAVVEQWFALPTVRMLSDAILAAYAIQNRAQLCTNDADFSRFPGLDWYNPLGLALSYHHNSACLVPAGGLLSDCPPASHARSNHSFSS